MTRYETVPKETLIVGSWSSTCNACGKQTINFEEHDFTSGYGPKEPACGVKFKYITSEYGDQFRERVQSMAPELEYVSLWKSLGVGNDS